MSLVFDSQLLEETVSLEIRRREEQGDPSLLQEYHELGDPIYESFPLEERDQQFEKLHLKFFHKLGLGEGLKKVLAEFPTINGYELRVRKALPMGEDKADLRTRGEIKSIEIKLKPALFLDSDRLARKLRHELMRVSDMLDSGFGYRNEANASSNPAEDWAIRESYSFIWDIYVDGRLAREGKETISDKEKRAEEFGFLYQGLPASQRRVAFEALWNARELTHDGILKMAKDPGQLLQWAGLGLEGKVVIPGSPCPLCLFPTHTWADLKNVEVGVLALVKEDFPAWQPWQGACERCLELYQAKVDSK